MKGTENVTARSNVIRLGRCALVMGLLLCWTGPSWSQNSDRVADIRVVGNRSIPTERVMYLIHTRIGDPFSLSRLHQDASRVAESRLFRNVRVQEQRTAKGIVINFHVEEYPKRIREVVYKNAHHVKDKKLEELTGIRRGMPMDPSKNRRAAYAIQEHLQQKGRYFANVSLEEGHRLDHDRVVFNITEGPIVRVGQTSFVGNKELATDGRLRTQLLTSRAFLRTFGGKYHPAMVDGDVYKIEEYYRDHGFLDVHVQRELLFSDDFRTVDVVFHIHEGKRYRVDKVSVEGPSEDKRAHMASIVQLEKGDYFSENRVTKDLKNITDYEGWRGYAASPKRELYFPEPGLVHVVYQVQDPPPQPNRVAEIHIHGNSVTQDRVIRRVLGLYPGQILRYPETRLAERNLARLGIFKTDRQTGVQPTVTVLESDTPYKDILVTVEEAPTGSFLLGAGINSNAGLVGSIVLNERNFDLFRPPTSFADIFEGRAFRGAGQEFRLEAVPGTQLQRYTMSFREPFLFDRPISLSTSAYYYDRLFNEYSERRIGGRFALGKQLTPEWNLSAGLRIEQVRVTEVPFFAPAEIADFRGNHFQAGPKLTLTHDTRDSYIRPTEGGVIEASYEHMFGDFTFPIFNAQASRYFTLYQRPDGSGRHVLAMRSTFGYAGSDVPVYERFYAGGFQSVRGFEFRGMGPTSLGFQVGGRFMWTNSIEYQLPVLASDRLYLVGFLDSGTVERDLEINDYRVTAGFGLRVTVPMLGPVPLALDFGFPIVQAASDREQIFSFWLGLYR